jgi:hypothetical protein
LRLSPYPGSAVREGRQIRHGDGCDGFRVSLPVSAAGWVADLPRPRTNEVSLNP